jgi:hypothetical protein
VEFAKFANGKQGPVRASGTRNLSNTAANGNIRQLDKFKPSTLLRLPSFEVMTYNI